MHRPRHPSTGGDHMYIAGLAWCISWDHDTTVPSTHMSPVLVASMLGCRIKHSIKKGTQQYDHHWTKHEGLNYSMSKRSNVCTRRLKHRAGRPKPNSTRGPGRWCRGWKHWPVWHRGTGCHCGEGVGSWNNRRVLLKFSSGSKSRNGSSTGVGA